jgi:hypothetical protein
MLRYRNKTTDELVDLPENVGNHPVLGRDYEVYRPKAPVPAPVDLVSTSRRTRSTTPKEKA